MIRPRSTMIFKILIKCLTFVSNAMLRVLSCDINMKPKTVIARNNPRLTRGYCANKPQTYVLSYTLVKNWSILPLLTSQITEHLPDSPNVHCKDCIKASLCRCFHFCHGVHQGHKRHRCGFTLMHWIPMGYNAFWTNWNVPHYYCTQPPPPCFNNSIQFYRFNCRKYFVHKFFLSNQFQWISMLIVWIDHLWIFVRNKTTATVAMSQNLFQKLINVHIPLYYGFISEQSVPCSDLSVALATSHLSLSKVSPSHNCTKSKTTQLALAAN